MNAAQPLVGPVKVEGGGEFYSPLKISLEQLVLQISFSSALMKQTYVRNARPQLALGWGG